MRPPTSKFILRYKPMALRGWIERLCTSNEILVY